MQSSLMAGNDDSDWPTDGNRLDCFRMLADYTKQSYRNSNKEVVILLGIFPPRRVIRVYYSVHYLSLIEL